MRMRTIEIKSAGAPLTKSGRWFKPGAQNEKWRRNLLFFVLIIDLHIQELLRLFNCFL